MSYTITPTDILTTHLQKAIADTVEAIANEEILKAQDAIEKKVKEQIAAIIIRLLRHCEVQTLQDRIIIEIKMDKWGTHAS